MGEFEYVEVHHVPHKHNTQAYILLKLESTQMKHKYVIQEVLTNLA